MDAGRKEDIKKIEKGLKSQTALTRKGAREALEAIKKEQHNGWVRDAREVLIREAQRGNDGNVLEIQTDIKKHTDLGKTSFFFSLPKHLK